MKSHVQKLLQRCGIYYRLKASIVYDLYWRIADPQLVRDALGEIKFYQAVLEGFQVGDLIFDVGANQGSKTRTFLRMGARVIAVEPDVTNQQILRESFLSLRIFSNPVTIVPDALSETTGTEDLWTDEPGSAKNTLSRKWVDILRQDSERFGQVLQFGHKTAVQTTTLDALIVEYGLPFFVKIDVEGAEPRVIRGLTKPVRYISFEVNLPEFLAEGLECIARLEQLTSEGRLNYVVNYQNGLELSTWLPAAEFSKRLSACNEKSVEVFWKSMNSHNLAPAEGSRRAQSVIAGR